MLKLHFKGALYYRNIQRTTEKGLQSCNKSQRCIPSTASEEKRNFKNGGNVRKDKTRIDYFRIIINTKSRDVSINIKKS